tara:strand:- start:25870 stop:26637 length:768 start_codon:yes stop_codon:yes gene_type:complete
MNRTIRTLLVCVALLCAPKADAAAILHYDDDSITGGNVVGQALTSLGEVPTVTDHANFATDLGSQPWDLVVVDISANAISAPNVASLIGYVNGGGKAILSYWDLDSVPALATAFEASVANDFFSPQSVHAWAPGHPIFNQPNAVASPITFTGTTFIDNGDELDAIGGGMALGGFSPAPMAGQAGIVLGNGGRTIVNGWLFDDLESIPGIDFTANEINFVLNGAAVVPEPTSLAVFGLGFCLAGFGTSGRRRRPKA